MARFTESRTSCGRAGADYAADASARLRRFLMMFPSDFLVSFAFMPRGVAPDSSLERAFSIPGQESMRSPRRIDEAALESARFTISR